ncbi:hypothetical protein WJX73_010168 [Symbiochloris irregularis]|uniref:Fibrous sheath-interacting protein 1 n=1 Tax=Symbiochloris irregularis TaxID=706552 RepID=A0AAW1PXK4_9CHLO
MALQATKEPAAVPSAGSLVPGLPGPEDDLLLDLVVRARRREQGSARGAPAKIAELDAQLDALAAVNVPNAAARWQPDSVIRQERKRRQEAADVQAALVLAATSPAPTTAAAKRLSQLLAQREQEVQRILHQDDSGLLDNNPFRLAEMMSEEEQPALGDTTLSSALQGKCSSTQLPSPEATPEQRSHGSPLQRSPSRMCRRSSSSSPIKEG